MPIHPDSPTGLSSAELGRQVAALRALQQGCQLCPRQCGARRDQGARGYCRQPAQLQLAICCPHRGEEPALCGQKGAGNVFVAGCTMRCVFCQNYQLSHLAPQPGWTQSAAAAAETFLELQAQGCHNIAWVSPTQHLPLLVEAWRLARERGLRLPLVYNSNGYERPEVLQLLSGIVDIYLPDAKYSDDELAQRYSDTPDYVEVHRRAIREMWRQVGPLQLSEDGLASRGLLIRHLVLPQQLRNTAGVLRWIAEELGPETWVSLMAQYYPAHRAIADPELPELTRPLSRKEYQRAVDLLLEVGLEQGWVQQRSSCRRFLPDFYQAEPFAQQERA